MYVMSKNTCIRNIKKNPFENFSFYSLKNLCILHGRVIVMVSVDTLTTACVLRFYDIGFIGGLSNASVTCPKHVGDAHRF